MERVLDSLFLYKAEGKCSTYGGKPVGFYSLPLSPSVTENAFLFALVSSSTTNHQQDLRSCRQGEYSRKQGDISTGWLSMGSFPRASQRKLPAALPYKGMWVKPTASLWDTGQPCLCPLTWGLLSSQAQPLGSFSDRRAQRRASGFSF